MFGILVFGDSISWGRGESPNIGWAGRLKKHFEPQGFHHCLLNLAVPGETTTKLLKRFETEIKVRVKYVRARDKFIVMIGIGMNDARGLGSVNKSETKPKVFEKNISKLIQIAKKHTKHVVVVGLTQVDENLTTPFEGKYYTNGQIQKYDEILERMSLENKVHYVDMFSKLKYMLVDGIHPGKKGYEGMYKIIKAFLVKKKLIKYVIV